MSKRWAVMRGCAVRMALAAALLAAPRPAAADAPQANAVAAESWAVLPPGGDGAAATKAEARAALVDGLRAANITPVEVPSAEAAREQGAAAAVLLQVWKATRARKQATVTVIVSGSGGDAAAQAEREWSADVPVERGDVPTATRRAVAEVLARRAQAGRVKFEVVSDPVGARLTLDREPVGVTPLTLSARPGGHALSLDLAGFAPVKTEITLAADAARMQRFAYALSPLDAGLAAGGEGGAKRGAAHASAAPSVPWLVAGGAAVVGGLALGVVPMATLATDGDAVTVDGESRRVRFGAGSALMLSGAVALVGAGVTVLLVEWIE